MSAVDSPRFRAGPVRFLSLAALGAIALMFGVHFATNSPVANAATITWTGTVTLPNGTYTIPAGTTVLLSPVSTPGSRSTATSWSTGCWR